MADNRKKITKKNNVSPEVKRRRLKAQTQEWKHPEWDTAYCFSAFISSDFKPSLSSLKLGLKRSASL